MINSIRKQQLAFSAVLGLTAAFNLATPEANAQQGVAGPKWSPDSNSIVFSAAADGDDFEIFVMGADGSNIRQLTRNDHTDIQPAFSNDGETIYFASTQDRGDDERDWDIAKVSPNGGAITRVFGEPGFMEYHPVELPDGRIGFSRRPRSNFYDSDFFVWDPKINQSELLINESPIEPRTGLAEIRIAAPLTGERILFNSRRNGHNEVFSANLDGGDVEQLTAAFRATPDNWLGHASPSVSADGRYFAVWTDQPAPKPATGHPEAYIVHKLYDRETGQSRYLPKKDLHRFMVYPSLSPDGSKVLFGAAIGLDGPAGPWGIFVQEIATGNVTELWRQPEDGE